MSGGENETVAVEPFGMSRIALQKISEEHRPDFCRTKRQAQMAGIALVHGIHGEATSFVGGFLEKSGVHVRVAAVLGMLRSAKNRGGLPTADHGVCKRRIHYLGIHLQ